jgi:RecA-family ATPase
MRIARLGDPLLNDLAGAVKTNGVRLLVLSPLISFLPGLEDANSQVQVRLCMDKLLQQIEGMNCAVLGLAHPSKQANATPMERIMGSSSFVQFVRSIIVLGEQDSIEARRMAQDEWHK